MAPSYANETAAASQRSEIFWERTAFCALTPAQITEATSSHLVSLIPAVIGADMASFEVVRGMLGRLFDYGPPAKMFAAAVVSVRQLPNTLALGVDWRLLCREVPELDPENPKGPIPPLANHPSLLILAVLLLSVTWHGSLERPRTYNYWTRHVGGGMWSRREFRAAVFFLERQLGVGGWGAGEAEMRAAVGEIGRVADGFARERGFF